VCKQAALVPVIFEPPCMYYHSGDQIKTDMGERRGTRRVLVGKPEKETAWKTQA
jgi:hypothetical protein